jgi:transcriptional regulator with XRE-family HTH domain
MTQDKLAVVSNADLRTVQRAEHNRAVQLETLASIAAALGVTVSEITVVGEAPVDLPESSAPDEHNAVVLRRTSSGKTLLDTLCDSFSGHLDCAADPTQENVDALTAFVEDIENLIANPWRTQWTLRCSPLPNECVKRWR